MIFLITRSLADGIRLFATALVIAVVTGVPVPWVVIVLGAAMIVYTVRGGVSAVIWTDVVQMFVYIAGAAAVAISLLDPDSRRLGRRWSRPAAPPASSRSSTCRSISAAPYTLWAGVLGGVALTLATHGTDQFLVQRLLSARSAREAARGLILSGFIVFAQFIVFLLIGVMLFVYYQQTPLPQPLARTDEILPVFVVNSLTHGLAGFIVAAIVAAALSPSLNAMAATTVNDFYLRYIRPDADQANADARVAAGDGRLGRGAARRRARRAVDGSLRARRRPCGAVVCFGRGPRRVPPRHADAARGRDATRSLGMIVGLVTMTAVWAWTTVAFTWYVFIGAAMTCIVAYVLSFAMAKTENVAA